MSAFHISGPSGSGKSTVGSILEQQGYRVIDTDFENNLSSWYNNETGERVTGMPVQPSIKWVVAHDWKWNSARMIELLDDVNDEPVFFCGSSFNEKDFYSHFEKRFGLCVDDNTLVNRLQFRDSERWADSSVELQRCVESNGKFREFSVSTGAIVIDSSVSPDHVAEIILSHIEK